MAPGAVEEVSPVAEGSPEVEHRSPGVRLDGKVVKLLAAVADRGHEERHDRSVHGSVVVKLQFVPDQKVRGHDGSPASTG